MFESYLSGVKELFGNTVEIIDINKFTDDEMRVVYRKEDDTKDTYIGTRNDIDEDFKETNKEFKVYKSVPKKDTKKKIKKYNLIYSKGGNKHDVLERNLLYPIAMKLKKDYSKDNNFKKEKLKIILQK